MPHRFSDIIRARTSPHFFSFTANGLVPGVLLEIPDPARKEACGDEVEEAGRDDEEYLEGCLVATTAIYEITSSV